MPDGVNMFPGGMLQSAFRLATIDSADILITAGMADFFHRKRGGAEKFNSFVDAAGG